MRHARGRKSDGDLAGLDAADPTDRGRALAMLVVAGRASTPLLLRALRSPDAGVREKAAQGLAEIGDPAAAAALRAALADVDPLVRGRAAQGLAAIGDPEALDALVQTLDAHPDVLHAPHTIATYVLIARGGDALPAVGPLLDAPLPLTRQRAYVVLQAVVPTLPGVEDWDRLWTSLGRYDPNDSDIAARTAAAGQWRQWIATHGP
jgi:HEAT repeat protein